MWNELLDLDITQLDTISQAAQDIADELPDGVTRELMENLAEAATLILQDKQAELAQIGGEP